ncbi:MAG: hypothetical protein K2F96_06015 [Muribaculaceae bacterium]|nr:hypothetical protein [Muribaculaceae bacterium]
MYNHRECRRNAPYGRIKRTPRSLRRPRLITLGTLRQKIISMGVIRVDAVS